MLGCCGTSESIHHPNQSAGRGFVGGLLSFGTRNIWKVGRERCQWCFVWPTRTLFRRRKKRRRRRKKEEGETLALKLPDLAQLIVLTGVDEHIGGLCICNLKVQDQQLQRRWRHQRRHRRGRRRIHELHRLVPQKPLPEAGDAQLSCEELFQRPATRHDFG